MSTIHTVTGEVAPSDLGVTYVHEHMLCSAPEGMQATSGGRDLVLDEEDTSTAELKLFAQAGGGAIIDLTCEEYGRDAPGLKRISEASGIKLICATGHIMEGYWTGVIDIASRTDTELVDEMIHDLTVGVDGTDIKAGVIKVGSSHNKVTADEERMIRAAVVAQRRDRRAHLDAHDRRDDGTGASRDLHRRRRGHGPRHHRPPRPQPGLGGAPRDRRSGARLGYDCISKEHYQPDAQRVEFVKRMIDEGYADRLCFSGDLARRSYLTSYGGGPGLTYILWRFVPWLASGRRLRRRHRRHPHPQPRPALTFTQ